MWWPGQGLLVHHQHVGPELVDGGIDSVDHGPGQWQQHLLLEELEGGGPPQVGATLPRRGHVVGNLLRCGGQKGRSRREEVLDRARQPTPGHLVAPFGEELRHRDGRVHMAGEGGHHE